MSQHTAVLAPSRGASDDRPMNASSATWAILGGVAVIIGFVWVWRRKPSENLGAVSDQWVAQHRATPPDEL